MSFTQSSTESATPPSALTKDLPLHSQVLGHNEVHLWQARLDDQLAGDLQLLLAKEEIARANRFRFARDRNHFIVARGLLRKLLAAYLGLSSPAELRFAYGEKGKPLLAPNNYYRGQSSINFNLTHSHGMALYAFSRYRELGVDLEFIRAEFANEKIADRFFSTTEVDALQNLPAELRGQGFFNCWTRKEAYIKARGEGLSMPLNEFDVSLAPGEPAALLRNHKDAAEVARWSMKSITVEAGYVAALVVEGHDWELKSFDLKLQS